MEIVFERIWHQTFFKKVSENVKADQLCRYFLVHQTMENDDQIMAEIARIHELLSHPRLSSMHDVIK